MSTSLSAARDTLTLLNINPGGLDQYLAMVEGRAGNPRVKCGGGRLLLVSPGFPHEGASDRIDTMLREVFDALDIPSRACGSTLFRGKGTDRGVEPDQSYYIQNFERVRGVEALDLAIHPPPDLVLEVVDAHSPALAMKVYRALGVPEVWLYRVRSRRLTMRVLADAGEGPRYVATDRSVSLPFLGPADVAPWAAFVGEDCNSLRRRARVWACDELARRREGC